MIGVEHLPAATARARPATASYRYRTPFHSAAPSGTPRTPRAPRRRHADATPPRRPSTAGSGATGFANSTLCVSPLARNRYHQGSFRASPRADLRHTASGRPIELMWSRGPAKPGVVPPPREDWDDEDYVFTNTQYVLRTMVDKALAHNTTLKTVQLYRDADKSHGHKYDLVNGSVVTKASIGKALRNLGFTLKPQQVDSIFDTLSERNTSKHSQRDKELGQMNAGTFLENLRDCHELDADKTHWTRFGSSMFAYTSRHENKGVDSRHRFPPKVLAKGEVCEVAATKKRREGKEQHAHPHLTTSFDPFHHVEPTKEHDHHLEHAQKREAFRRKQRAAQEYRRTHTHKRKKKSTRTNEFVTTTKTPIWGKYDTSGKHAPVPFLRTRNKSAPGSSPRRPQIRRLRASDPRPHPGIRGVGIGR